MTGTMLDIEAVRMRQAEQVAQAWRTIAIISMSLLAGAAGGWMLKPNSESRVFELRLSLPSKTAAAADATARATLETGMEPIGLEDPQ